MKAVRFHEFGGSEVLRFEEVPDLDAGPGEVVIKIRASGLNHVDVDIREGLSRLPIRLPHTPGLEPIGTIERIGPGVVGGWQKGDRVHVYLLDTCMACRFCRSGCESLCDAAGLVGLAADGGWAQTMRAPDSMLIRIPANLPDEEAAAVPIAFATA